MRDIHIGIKIGELALPCAACGTTTAHSLAVEVFDPILHRVDLAFQCLGCHWGWTRGIYAVDSGRGFDFIKGFAESDSHLWEHSREVAAYGEVE